MNRLTAFAFAGLLAGCATAAATKESAMDQHVTLLPERSIALGQATLRYDGAADSRCPPGMKCVWAGEISYKFTLSGAAGTESFALSRARPSFEAGIVKGARIALAESAEPPLQAAGAPAQPFPVTLSITTP